MTTSKVLLTNGCQMDSNNSKVTFVTKLFFLRTFVIITSHCNVICDDTKLEGQVTGIGQSSPGSFISLLIKQKNNKVYLLLLFSVKESLVLVL